MSLGRAHLVLGLVVLAVFAGTGAWMRTRVPELGPDRAAERFLLRANHVYLLGAGLANVALALGFARAASGWRRNLQSAGSFLYAVAPLLLFAAFVREPWAPSPQRPLTSFGWQALALGTIFHLLARLPRRGAGA